MFLREFLNLEEKPGCNMTNEGRACAVHGLAECPGYKMIETSTQEKLHQQHQEIRKKSGLPNPNYYKELRATFDLPHKERFARVAELKKKYKIKEQEITGHGQFTTKDMGSGTKVSFDPASGAKTISGAGGTTTYNTQGQKTAYQTPTVGGTSQTTNFQTGEKTTTMNQGPVSASITQRPDQSKVTSTSAQLGDVAVSAHQGVGFGGAGKDVGQGGNVISTITNPQGKTASYAGRIPTSQEIGAAINEKDLEEAGPFSYGAKKPRKGSVADLAAKKRKEQEKDRQPVEPRDHMVGVARVKKGVAEGISVVDQDYDLDQMVLTLDIEGKKVYFTYWDYEEDFSNAERRDVFDQLQEQPWYKGLDHPTKMEILDAAYRAIRGLEPQEYRPTVGDEPLDEQDVAEGSIYKKDQDLSSIPTQELEAFVRKHWFGGIPTYGQGESVKRAMRELRRRQKQGVAEGSLNEGVMDQLKRIYMMLVSDLPMGTPESEFLEHWQRIIQDDLGKRIDIDTLAQLRDNFVNRYKTMGRRGDVGDWHREMGQDFSEGSPPMGFVRSPQRHDPIKNPLRTFVEISNLLGITHNQLNALTKKYPGFPSPHPGIGKQVGRGKNNYYDLQQAKQWIKNNDIQNRIKSWSSNKEQGVVEGKDDLSKYSTEQLKSYVKKVSGGGVPAFGSGAKLKRVQAELKRREQGVAEDAIDDRLTAQYNTPQMQAKSQSIDQAFASGNQQDFDRLGIISPQQIERDYQAMRAKEPAQDAALYANPKLTPGARSASTFRTNPRGVPMKEKYDVEEDSSYMDTKPGSVTAQQAQDFDDAAKRAFKPKYYNNDNEPAPKKRDWDYSDPEIAPLVKDWMNKNLIDRKPLTAPARNKDSIDESIEQYLEELDRAGYEVITETAHTCPECGGPAFANRMLAEKKDACYSKVKSRYKVWPSAYASGALVRCRKVGAKNWGNKSKK